MNKAAKILITGGAGFIGSNLVDHLVENGFETIRVLDNLETGSLKNIEKHITSGKVEFIQADITDPLVCMKACSDIDIVLHQAALGSVPRSIENPVNTHNVNVNGFINILEAARKNKVKRLVYASSSSVYGNDKNLPKIEDQVGDPLSPYAVSKKTNELYAKVYASLYQLEVIGLRYFNVFGPKQNPNGAYAAVIPIFVSRLMRNESCKIFGDGENKRDFTYIENVVEANMKAAFTSNPSALNEVYNVAYGATKSVNDLYQLVCKELGSNAKAMYESPRPGEIKDSFASVAKAETLLSYTPKVSLEEGIVRTIAWYKTNLPANYFEK